MTDIVSDKIIPPFDPVLHLRDAYGDGSLDVKGLLSSITQLIENEDACAAQELEGAMAATGELALRRRLCARHGALFNTLCEAFHRRSVEGAALRNVGIPDLVVDGDMTPDQAEEWAKTFRWGRFASLHTRNRCDPDEQVEWSLLMSAAWIEWRESRFVAWLKPDETEFLPRWTAIEHEDGSTGYDLEPFVDLSDAKHRLLKLLQSGQLKASGHRAGLRVNIRPAEWADLRFVDDEGCVKVVTLDGDIEAYQRVLVSRKRLMDEFPASEKTKVKVRKKLTIDLAVELLTKEAQERGGPIRGKVAAVAYFKNFSDEISYYGRNEIHEAVERQAPNRGPGRQPKSKSKPYRALLSRR